MAFVKNNLNDDEAQLSNSDSTPDNATNVQGQAAQAGPTSAPSSSSGGWTNLSSYLNANKPQAAQLGTDVAGTINKETEEAKGAIGNAENQFGQKVNENRLKYDQGALDRTIQSGNVEDQIRQQLGGTYGGPQDWQSAGLNDAVNKEVGEAQTKGQLTNDVGGRTELLRQASANPQTTGNLKLNQLFLQSNPEAAKALQEASAQTTPLTAQEQEAQARGGALTTAAQNEAAAIGAQTKGAIGNALGQEQANREAKLASEKQRILNEQAAAKDYLNKLGGQTNSLGALLPGWEKAGLTQEQAQALQQQLGSAAAEGVSPTNLSNYYTGIDPNSLTTANVVSPEQAARITALSQLIGQQGINAGSAIGNAGTFNAAGANADIAGRIQSSQVAKQAQDAQDRMIAEQEQANNQLINAANKSAKAQKQASTLGGAASGAAAGFSIGGPIGGVIGGIVGAVFCFEETTEVIMEDGSSKEIRHIEIGDKVLLGGFVTGIGKFFVDELYEYKNMLMTPTHVLYHETDLGNYWTTAKEVGTKIKLKTNVALVCPIMTETHLMIAGDFISTDVLLVTPEIDPEWKMNQPQKIEFLNNLHERNRQLDQMIEIKREKIKEYSCSI